jgi:hypothetical protein
LHQKYEDEKDNMLSMLKVPLIGEKKTVFNVITRISWIIAGLSGLSSGFLLIMRYH